MANKVLSLCKVGESIDSNKKIFYTERNKYERIFYETGHKRG